MSAHGTPSRYTNEGCRCVKCRRAATESMRAVSASHRAAFIRLRNEHRVRFDELLAEEKAIRGVRQKPGRPKKDAA